MTKVLAIANQKGGVGKTTTAINLGAELGRSGKAVLLVDLDMQANLTLACGITRPDELSGTIADVFRSLMAEVTPKGCARALGRGLWLIPANIELAGIETGLVNTLSREMLLKEYLDCIKDGFDYVIIDCSPSLGMLTTNALVAADSVIIPTQADYLSLKGFEMLLGNISKIQKRLNPTLKIGGIVVTMVDRRGSFTRQSIEALRNTYGESIRVFDTEIPKSIKTVEASAVGESIGDYDRNNKVAQAYRVLSEEVRNG